MNKGKSIIPILSVTGSDGTGGSGIQADIKTCGVLGGYALSVVTAVTVQDTRGIHSTHPMPTDIIDAQLGSITLDMTPCAVKIGMLCDAQTVLTVSRYTRRFNHVVLDTAFISSRGEAIASPDVIDAVCHHIMPLCDIVIMKHSEAQMLLRRQITDKEGMFSAATTLMNHLNIQAIIIQGTQNAQMLCNDLFVMRYDDGTSLKTFYVRPDGTQRNTHGLAGTLSASIATHLAQRLELKDAVARSYDYINHLTVYSVSSLSGESSSLLNHSTNKSHGNSHHTVSISPRQTELYNALMQLVVNHAHTQHDVAFYADKLNITTRYLAQITSQIADKTPKQIIIDTLMDDAKKMLSTTAHSIQEIAFALGFGNQGLFAKVFKQNEGTSPSNYRSQI